MFAGIWPIVLGFCMRVDESRATSSEQTYQASSFSDVDASRHNETRPPEVCDSFWPEFPFCHAPLIGQQQKSLTWPKVVRRTQATSFKEIETCSRGACSKTKSYEVWGLEKTFAFIKNGSSISRFGDGELRLMEGAKHINHGMEIGGKQLRMKLNVVASWVVATMTSFASDWWTCSNSMTSKALIHTIIGLLTPNIDEDIRVW